MDVERFVGEHRADWDRVDALSRRARRPRRLRPAELDELADGYARVAAHLAQVRAGTPDPVLLARLSQTVTAARGALTGSRGLTRGDVARFVTATFPAAVWRRRWWVLGTAAANVAVMVALAVWIDHAPTPRALLLPPADARSLVAHDFAAYYRSAPASHFALRVWTNNALVSAEALTFGVLLGLPTALVLAINSVNVGVEGGILASAGRGSEFLTLILPHGMLELSAVFIAGASGLRLGWRWLDPGPRGRAAAVGSEARDAVTVAVGLVGVLAVSGVLEAFVTPAPWPAWLRLATGGAAELALVALVCGPGRRAAAERTAPGADGNAEDPVELTGGPVSSGGGARHPVLSRPRPVARG